MSVFLLVEDNGIGCARVVFVYTDEAQAKENLQKRQRAVEDDQYPTDYTLVGIPDVNGFIEDLREGSYNCHLRGWVGKRVKISEGHNDFPQSLQGQTGTILSFEDDHTAWVIPDAPVPESPAEDFRWLLDLCYLTPC